MRPQDIRPKVRFGFDRHEVLARGPRYSCVLEDEKSSLPSAWYVRQAAADTLEHGGSKMRQPSERLARNAVMGGSVIFRQFAAPENQFQSVAAN